MQINKEIFRLSIPNILSNISVPLIATVDTGLMGYQSTFHLAAVGSISMIFSFLYWNFGFLRMGATGLIAQAHGSGNKQEKKRIFVQALMMALILSFILVLGQHLLKVASFYLMNLDGQTAIYGAEYFYIRIWDAPGVLVLYVMMAWFFGSKNAIIPLIITLVINGINIVFSVYFVKYLGWGISGVAYGSVLGTYAGLLVAVICLWKQGFQWTVPWNAVQEGLARFLNINKDIFLRTFMLSITFAFLYSQAALYGAIVMSVNVVLLQLLNWMSYGIDGFAYAAESLVGNYKGAKQNRAMHNVVNKSMLWAGILACIYFGVYSVYYEGIIRIFTNDAEVLRALKPYRIWIASVPIVAFVSYVWDGVFIGLTASKAMRNSMFLAFVCYFVTYFMLKDTFGFDALLTALTVYLIVRGVVQTYLYQKKGTALS